MNSIKPVLMDLEAVGQVRTGLVGILFKVSLVPDIAVEVEVDVPQFDSQLKILVDVVVGIKVDFKGMVLFGQVQSLSSGIGGTPAELPGNIFIVGTSVVGEAQIVLQIFHVGDIVEAQLNAPQTGNGVADFYVAGSAVDAAIETKAGSVPASVQW